MASFDEWIGVTPEVKDEVSFGMAFVQIASMETCVWNRNQDLAALMANSAYVDRLFKLVWRRDSSDLSLLDELKSVTLFKRLCSNRVPQIRPEKVGGFVFQSIRNNWITICTKEGKHRGHRRLLEVSAQSEFPTYSEECTEAKLNAGLSGLEITGSQLRESVLRLLSVDPLAGICIQFKLLGKTEPQVASILGKSLNQIRNHMRRGKSELKILLIQLQGGLE